MWNNLGIETWKSVSPDCTFATLELATFALFFPMRLNVHLDMQLANLHPLVCNTS